MAMVTATGEAPFTPAGVALEGIGDFADAELDEALPAGRYVMVAAMLKGGPTSTFRMAYTADAEGDDNWVEALGPAGVSSPNTGFRAATSGGATDERAREHTEWPVKVTAPAGIRRVRLQTEGSATVTFYQANMSVAVFADQ